MRPTSWTDQKNVSRNVIDRSIYLNQIMPLCWMIMKRVMTSSILVNLCVSARTGCTAYCNHCRGHEIAGRGTKPSGSTENSTSSRLYEKDSSAAKSVDSP